MSADLYREAARIKGWIWSPTHNGYIHDHHRVPGRDLNSSSSHMVAFDSEDACFISGVETLDDAAGVVREHSA